MTFTELAEYFGQLEETPSRLKMTELLSDLFKKAHKDEIRHICYLLQGRVVPLYEAVEFGIADKFAMRAIARACDADLVDVLASFKRTGDLGVTAQHIKNQISTIKNLPQKTNINEVFRSLDSIARTGGAGSQEKKIDMLSELLKSADPLSARYLVRIPLDKMRLGFSAMTILDALSWMIAGDKSLREKLELVYNVRPDIGFIAETLKSHGIDGLSKVKATVGAPILAALCQRLPNATEMIKKMGEVDVEPKYDGVRCQIHFRRLGIGGKGQDGVSRVMYHVADSKRENKVHEPSPVVQSFSRNLENTTEMFPELLDIGGQLNAEEVILDSEAVGIDPITGKILPFQETSTRKRKHDIGLFSASVPIRFFVFDILYKDGEELLPVPLVRRRQILEGTIKPGPLLEISPHIVTSDIQALRDYHAKQLSLGLEGAVVKKWDSIYEPGRRGYNWVKFKESEGRTGKLNDTVDCVVMGYYRGEGKRADFGIGAFLVGIKNNDTFVTVSKIGTGVSDALWHELKTMFARYEVHDKPKEYDVEKGLTPDVWLTPEIVVEVAGDEMTKSPNHSAGVAIRFPRLVRIRDDKSPEQTTTMSELSKIV